MRIAVFGPSGMLGRYVMRSTQAAGHEAVPIHRRMFELLNPTSIKHVIEESKCEGVINCAGMIPLKSSNSIAIDMMQVNGIFPHILVEQTSPLPILLVSTDCVFSGRNRYKYTTDNTQDPRDYYGKSKAYGEVLASNAMVVRTSFIGCEHGLMNMVLNAGQLAKTSDMQVNIDGWKCALWTGSTVQAVADALVDLLTNKFDAGIAHLAAEKTTTKFEVVTKLVELNGFNVLVRPVYHPVYNRGLVPTHVLQDVYTALDEYKCTQVLKAA